MLKNINLIAGLLVFLLSACATRAIQQVQSSNTFTVTIINETPFDIEIVDETNIIQGKSEGTIELPVLMNELPEGYPIYYLIPLVDGLVPLRKKSGQTIHINPDMKQAVIENVIFEQGEPKEVLLILKNNSIGVISLKQKDNFYPTPINGTKVDLSPNSAYLYKIDEQNLDLILVTDNKEYPIAVGKTAKGNCYEIIFEKNNPVISKASIQEYATKYSSYNYYSKGLKSSGEMAIKYFTSAIKIDPNFALAYQERGRIFDNMSMGRETTFSLDQDLMVLAFNDFEQVIKVAPNLTDNVNQIMKKTSGFYSDYYVKRAEQYRGEGKYDASIADCNQSIKINPGNSFAYWTRGESYRMKMMYDQAISDCNQAIILITPATTVAYIPKRTDTKSDKAFLEEWYETNRQDARKRLSYAYATRGMAYYDKGQKGKAIQDLVTAISIYPENQWAKDSLNTGKQGR